MEDKERSALVARRLFAAAVMIEQALSQVNEAVDIMQGGERLSTPNPTISRPFPAPLPPEVTDKDVVARPEPTFEDPRNAPSCVSPEGHDWMRFRRGGEYSVDGCRVCPAKRWIPSIAFVEGSGATWNYGPIPPPRAARVMAEGEKLAEGEEWQDADGNIPRTITTPAPQGKRALFGREIERD